jgi:UDP-N-acetylmuramate--alanine ligase
MSGLALVARQLGAEVTGSDRAESSYSARLRAAGIEPVIGHATENVPDGAEVVVSTAIPESNPELARARELGLPVLHRGDLLAEVTGLKRSIAVAGAHGKTTTTGMLTHILRATGRDPAFVIGGELREAGTNAAWGEGDWIVVEADESDRSFLKLKPDVAVITNIELDHHTTYASEAELAAAFDEFASQAGEVIAWEEAPLQAEARRFAIDTNVTEGSDPLRLRVPGEHNVLNALAAVAAAEVAGVPRAEAIRAVETFDGTGRRFEPRGTTAAGARIFDDYAHHPTEVRATIAAAQTLGAERVVAVFQPHLYSRT